MIEKLGEKKWSNDEELQGQIQWYTETLREKINEIIDALQGFYPDNSEDD